MQKNNKGFSLVELLVGIAVLGLLILPLYTLINSSIKYTEQSHDTGEASSVANNILEQYVVQSDLHSLITNPEETEETAVSPVEISGIDGTMLTGLYLTGNENDGYISAASNVRTNVMGYKVDLGYVTYSAVVTIEENHREDLDLVAPLNFTDYVFHKIRKKEIRADYSLEFFGNTPSVLIPDESVDVVELDRKKEIFLIHEAEFGDTLTIAKYSDLGDHRVYVLNIGNDNFTVVGKGEVYTELPRETDTFCLYQIRVELYPTDVDGKAIYADGPIYDVERMVSQQWDIE